MKQLVVAGAVLFTALSLQAQVGKRTSAYEYWRTYQTDTKKNIKDLQSALTNIEEASKHEKTSKDAKTWYYKAQILNTIVLDKDPAVNALVKNGYQEVANAYKMAYELDMKGDKAAESKTNAIAFSGNVVNEGVKLHNDNQLEQAVEKYKFAYDLQKALDKTNTDIINNWAIALTGLKRHEEAAKLYIDLAQNNVDASKNYASASKSFRDAGKPEEALKYIKEARKANPNDLELIKAEVNFYLKNNQNALAEPLLVTLKEKGENDPKILSLLGSMEQEKGNDDAAIKYYQDALKLDDKNLLAYFNVGAMLNNQGVKLYKEVEEQKDLKKQKAGEKQAEAKLDAAAIHFEKCLELNDHSTPENANIYNESKNQLLKIYVRLERMEKYEALKQMK